MTADRLDEATEARIREACPSIYHDGTHSRVCICGLMRAAIKADREAREKSTLFITYDEAATQEDCDAFIAALSKPGNKISMVAIHDVAVERAHADALAEALRAARNYYVKSYPNDSVAQWDRLLASHDARRGK